MDQGKLMCEGSGLSRVKYVVQMTKKAILHKMDGYFYPTLQKLAIEKVSAHLAVIPQFNSRSDRHNCNMYFQFQILTVGDAGGLTGLGGG
jgi:hypothetical protein